MDVFLRELPTIAPTGAVLILDDFHLVDEAPDMQYIVRELIARGPERLSIVFASRRRPSIPLARLRANGEVAELGTDDLRFDADETARLFSETYGRTLEPGGPGERRGANRRLGSVPPTGSGGPPRSLARRRSGGSFAACRVPIRSSTTTSPRKSSATYPTTSSNS